MDSNMNASKESPETILVYNPGTGEVQIIAPKSVGDKYLTTEGYITLDKVEAKRVYLFLKNIFEGL